MKVIAVNDVISLHSYCSRWYIKAYGCLILHRTFKSITSAQKFINLLESEEFKDIMKIFGLEYDNTASAYVGDVGQSTIQVKNIGDCYVLKTDESSEVYYSDIELIDGLDDLVYESNKKLRVACVFMPRGIDSNSIMASISSRELTSRLVRVKSSNIWAYTMNVRDSRHSIGDVLIQFKGKNGGPEDIYIYYDVPVKVWQKFITAPSKGHYFWVNIRNKYKYAKLTGDKHGKLPNAVR